MVIIFLAILMLAAVALRLFRFTSPPKVRFPLPALRVKSLVVPFKVLLKLIALSPAAKVLALLPVKVTRLLKVESLWW